MNENDDPKHPAESKPNEKPTSISPTLGRKLAAEYDDEDDFEDDSKSSNLMAIGLLVVILGIGAVLAFAMTRGKKAEEEPSGTEEVAAVADSAADSSLASTDTTSSTTPPATTPPATPPPGASASATPKPAATPAKPAATPSRLPAASTPAASTPAAPAPAKTGHFGIAVGTYLNEERAKSELARLAPVTSLEGMVLTVKEDGGDAFRVVLGDFPSRAEAEKKADELASGAQVREARVIPIKK